MWAYAAIQKLYGGVYGTYDCTDGIEHIFTSQFKDIIQRVEFYKSWTQELSHRHTIVDKTSKERIIQAIEAITETWL